MYYKALIEGIIKDMEAQIFRCDSLIRNSPEGVLARNRYKGNNYYAQRVPPRGFRKTEKRMGINKRPDLIAGLAQKKLAEIKMQITKDNMHLIKKVMERYVPVNDEIIIDRMNGAYASLDRAFFDPNIPPRSLHGPYPVEQDKETGNRFGRLSNSHMFRPEDLIHCTPSGLYVRSKSELVIAGRLEHYGISFDYEPVLQFGAKLIRPDFVIRAPRDMRTKYWEHAGMMGNSQYKERHQAKMRIYDSNNIHPWDNLIVTYDSSDGGLDVRIVDAMIKGWLL